MREYAKKDVDITLIGNKVDLVEERQVDYKMAKDFADDNYLPYIEVESSLGMDAGKLAMLTCF